MFKLLQSNRAVWMRAVTVTAAVTAAVIAILVSALAVSPEIDHRVLPTQSTVISAVDAGVADDGFAQPAADKNCHIGHSCIFTMMPGSELALARFDRAPVFIQVKSYQLSKVGDLVFHPPRVLSQV